MTKQPTINDKDLRYEVTVKGRYFAPAEQGTKMVPYQVTIPMTGEMVRKGVLSQFKNNIGKMYMQEHFPDFTSFATHEVVNQRCISHPDKKPILDLMSRADMVEYIEDNGLSVVEDVYEDADSLKQAIIDCEANEEIFKQNQKRFMDRYGEKIRMRRQARDLMEQMNANKQQEANPLREEVTPEQVQDLVGAKQPSQSKTRSTKDAVLGNL